MRRLEHVRQPILDSLVSQQGEARARDILRHLPPQLGPLLVPPVPRLPLSRRQSDRRVILGRLQQPIGVTQLERASLLEQVVELNVVEMRA